MSGAVVAADDVAVLKQLVVRHKVCWEVVPIWHVPLGGRKVKIGFEVELFGTHDHPKHSPAPRWGAMIVAVFFALGSTIRTGEERLGRLHRKEALKQ